MVIACLAIHDEKVKEELTQIYKGLSKEYGDKFNYYPTTLENFLDIWVNYMDPIYKSKCVFIRKNSDGHVRTTYGRHTSERRTMVSGDGKEFVPVNVYDYFHPKKNNIKEW